MTSNHKNSNIMGRIFSFKGLSAIAAALVVTLLSITPSHAQGILDGTWHGDLDVQGSTLTIVFSIGEKTTLSVPQQSAKDIPALLESSSPVSIKISVPSIGADYQGMLVRGKIVGKFTQSGQEFPLTLEKGELAKANRPQTPTTHEGYSEKEVAFTNGEATLKGTLSVPDKGTGFAVLFVTGSGQQNRDEELFEHKPFAVIADALAKQGIASLRYDDRGFGESTGDPTFATTKTFAEDAAEGIKFLKEEGFDKVGVLGHSEGGTIAFILGSEEKVDFLVSLAGMSQRGDSTLIAQLTHQLRLRGAEESGIKAYVSAYVDQVKAQNNPWMNYFLELDPLPYIKNVKCPSLILNGEKDSQVLPSKNIPIIKDNLKGATIKVYPGLNHLFQHCDTGLGTEYMEIEETISTEVLDDIARWILAL